MRLRDLCVRWSFGRCVFEEGSRLKFNVPAHSHFLRRQIGNLEVFLFYLFVKERVNDQSFAVIRQ